MVNIQQAIRVINGKKVSLWEEKFSLERLEAILKQSGKIIFNMQYKDTELAKGKFLRLSISDITRSIRLIMIFRPLRYELKQRMV